MVDATHPILTIYKNNGGMSFSNDYIEIANEDATDMGLGDMSYSAWFKFTGAVAHRRILSNGIYGGAGLDGLALAIYNGAPSDPRYGKLTGFFAADGQGEQKILSINRVDDSLWHHAALVINGSTAKLYLDGQNVVTDASVTVGSTASDLHIGKCQWSAGAVFNGTIDEVRISNLARDFSWINTSYNNQKNPNTFFSIGSEEVDEDTTPPEITDVDASPDPQEVGGYVNISCEVTDYSGVDVVTVNITYPDNSYLNETMLGGSYYYIASYTMLGTYSYFIWANDTSGNSDISATYTFAIQDTILPELLDNTPATAYTGDAFTFNATITDAVGVSTAWVEYWYGMGTHTNMSMTNVAGDYWEKTIVINDTLDILHYVIAANDTSNNWNSTGTKNVIIYDNENPGFKQIQAVPPIQIPGGYVNISCEVTDNSGVDVVTVNITYPDNSYHNETMLGGSYYYNVTYDLLGIYNYFIWANDTSGNSNISTTYGFQIEDITSPYNPYFPPQNEPPVADANGPYYEVEDVPLTFDGSNSYDPDTEDSIVSYSWDFGDGSTGEGVSPQHIYPSDGNYTVNLTVTDSNGAQSKSTTYVNISIAANGQNGDGKDGEIPGFETIFVIMAIAFILICTLKKRK